MLRRRDPDGAWHHVPIANYTLASTPTRPIALLDPEEERLSIVYTSLDNSRWNLHSVASRAFDLRELTPSSAETLVLAPHLDLQNATSCKSHWPGNAPRIVLASDRWGNVYEGVLGARPD
jgi:hypothetical protein